MAEGPGAARHNKKPHCAQEAKLRAARRLLAEALGSARASAGDAPEWSAEVARARWRQRRRRRRRRLLCASADSVCPLTLSSLGDLQQAVLASDGHWYEASALLLLWLSSGGAPRSPLTRRPLRPYVDYGTFLEALRRLRPLWRPSLRPSGAALGDDGTEES